MVVGTAVMVKYVIKEPKLVVGTELVVLGIVAVLEAGVVVGTPLVVAIVKVVVPNSGDVDIERVRLTSSTVLIEPDSVVVVGDEVIVGIMVSESSLEVAAVVVLVDVGVREEWDVGAELVVGEVGGVMGTIGYAIVGRVVVVGTSSTVVLLDSAPVTTTVVEGVAGTALVGTELVIGGISLV